MRPLADASVNRYFLINKINKYSFIMTSDKPQMKYNGNHRYWRCFLEGKLLVMNKFIHHEGRLNNNMQKWKKEKEKNNNNR